MLVSKIKFWVSKKNAAKYTVKFHQNKNNICFRPRPTSEIAEIKTEGMGQHGFSRKQL